MRNILLFLFPVLFVACETSETGMSDRTGWMHHDWTMMGYGWGGILFWLLIIAVVIILFGVLQNQMKSPNNTLTSHETPLDILKKRYARGEISKEEFDRMKDYLL